jgi:hypothetical protein
VDCDICNRNPGGPRRSTATPRSPRPDGCVWLRVSSRTAGLCGGPRNAFRWATPPQPAGPTATVSCACAANTASGRSGWQRTLRGVRAALRPAGAGRPMRHRRIHPLTAPSSGTACRPLASKERAAGESVRRFERSRPGELVHLASRFAARDVTAERVLTDNAWAYTKNTRRDTCRDPGISPRRTRPGRPQTNGKVERFYRTRSKNGLTPSPTCLSGPARTGHRFSGAASPLFRFAARDRVPGPHGPHPVRTPSPSTYTLESHSIFDASPEPIRVAMSTCLFEPLNHHGYEG